MWIAVLLGLWACGESPAGPGGDSDLLAPTRLDIVAGNGQTDTVGQTLVSPLVVRVLAGTGASLSGSGAADVPVVGQVVTFVVVEGGGSVFAGTATTDSLGQVAEVWTFGTAAGAQRLEARAVRSDGTPIVYATATGTAVPEAPATLTLATDTARTWLGVGIDLAPLVFRVADRFGNPVPNAPLGFAVTADWSLADDFTWSTDERYGTATVTAAPATATVTLVALRDLRRTPWVVSYACRDAAMVGRGTGAPEGLDSLLASGPAGILYRTDPGFQVGVGGAYQLTVPLTMVRFWGDGVVDTVTAGDEALVVESQAPGTLALRRPSGLPIGDMAWNPWANEYVGGPFCSSDFAGYLRPLRVGQ
jgi:hypothetical protein